MKKCWLFVLVFFLFSSLNLHAEAAGQKVYIGSWDLNGDGRLEAVYNTVDSILVASSDGKTASYKIPSAGWHVAGGADLDGKAGAELVVVSSGEVKWPPKAPQPVPDPDPAVPEQPQTVKRLAKSTVAPFNGVYVINHVDRTVKTYSVPYGNWAITNVTDTDGQAGNELVIIERNKIMIVNDRLKSAREHTVPSGNWGFWNVVKAADTDGRAGAELVVTVGNKLYVFNDTKKNFKSYDVPYLSWTFYDTADTDGKPGEEIILKTQDSVYLVKDHQGTGKNYVLGGGAWSIADVLNIDGIAGKEILISIPQKGLQVITDRTGTIKPR
ncbi:hypothetical protein MMJ63_00285 [Bacillus vallismortis]|nr:hypothetical protein [Bacillus vallismortis]